MIWGTMKMDDKDLIIKVTEAIDLGKNNASQITELKDDIKVIKAEQKAIHQIATAVEILAKDLTVMKESISKDMSIMKNSLDEVREGQKEMTCTVDEKIEKVRQDVLKVDSKGKVDVVSFLAEHWYKIVLGVGGLTGIFYYIENLLEK